MNLNKINKKRKIEKGSSNDSLETTQKIRKGTEVFQDGSKTDREGSGMKETTGKNLLKQKKFGQTKNPDHVEGSKSFDDIKKLEGKDKINNDSDANSYKKLLQIPGFPTHFERKKLYRTVSIAIPASTIEKTLKSVLKSYVVGQIARAAATFRVDEIVIFKDGDSDNQVSMDFISTILQYMECPQYLKSTLFKISPYLKHAGILNALNSPHHLRENEIFEYREGTIVHHDKRTGQTYAEVGLKQRVLLRNTKCLSNLANKRITVHLDNPDRAVSDHVNFSTGHIVEREEVIKKGIYWGYTVRKAYSFSAVFTESPYDDGYDCSIGTSDKGIDIDKLGIPKVSKHVLIVFGGVEGLEDIVRKEETALDTTDPRHVFDFYVNSCPNQGCRTIRTEEAVSITLAALRPKIFR